MASCSSSRGHNCLTRRSKCVYFFLLNNSDVKELKPGTTEEMKALYLKFLKESGYSFEDFPNVVFEIDSDENVRKKYGGSYFNRLR